MAASIDDHRAAYGVEPICEVLPIAPSTYCAFKAQEADPSLRSARKRRDEELKVETRRLWGENKEVYGGQAALATSLAFKRDRSR